MKKDAARFLWCWLLLAGCPFAPAQPWLDRLDEALFIQSSDGAFRADLSGLLDVEGYYIDQLPPGLLFSSRAHLIQPRASLFLDTRLGPHFYGFVQARFDRGFDPGVRPRGDYRFDEYFLRWTPWNDARLSLQAGKFATVFGSWVNRHDSWNNPLITPPLVYENVTAVGDQAAPASPAALLKRRGTPDIKTAWLPVIWGPAYTTGALVFGQWSQFDYALELKNASISSRPTVWDGTQLGWEHPTVSGRLGRRPDAAWNLGASFSHGAYLIPAPGLVLPAGTGRGDFNQTTVGTDAGYAWRHWQLWAEAMASRFEVPNVGDADCVSYYLEAKYKINPRLFAAARWNQQFFAKVPDGAGGGQRWDNDIWRLDLALGCRLNRHWQGKLQYSLSRQQGRLQQGEQLVAAQVTVKF